MSERIWITRDGRGPGYSAVDVWVGLVPPRWVASRRAWKVGGADGECDCVSSTPWRCARLLLLPQFLEKLLQGGSAAIVEVTPMAAEEAQ